MRKAPPTTFSTRQQTIAWQSASLLLDYPDTDLASKLALLIELSGELPAPLAEPLRSCASALTAAPLPTLQEQYVDTFDSRRRCNLFLTYFLHGDTRKRGVALLRFKQTYLRSGFILDDSELPDHLCVVLEYAALVDQHLGRRLLLDHRAGLELLRLALQDRDSPWWGAVDLVCATLPPLHGDERAAIQRLAAEGPPSEEVGLTPYGTPQFDPLLAEPRTTDLPMPVGLGGVR